MPEYLGIDDAGLHIRVAEGEPQVLPVDTVIVCAGQDPLRELQDGLLAAERAPDRWRRRRRRAGCQARHQPGFAPGRRTLESLSAICCVAEKLR
ncbi:hypothetical protein P4233_19280 [Pseudomonas aeruginosa]|nr:hypothetical protein [Pseudomonas aeruginosa]